MSPGFVGKAGKVLLERLHSLVENGHTATSHPKTLKSLSPRPYTPEAPINPKTLNPKPSDLLIGSRKNTPSRRVEVRRVVTTTCAAVDVVK